MKDFPTYLPDQFLAQVKVYFFLCSSSYKLLLSLLLLVLLLLPFSLFFFLLLKPSTTVVYFVSFLMLCLGSGLVLINTKQLSSRKPKLRFCTGSNPVCSMSEIHNGENLWYWSRLEVSLNTFRWSTIL